MWVITSIILSYSCIISVVSILGVATRFGGKAGRSAVLLLIGALALFMLPQRAIGEDIPRRVASINLCTDQYLLALADRSQIVGLTRLASDPETSYLAARSDGIATTGGSAEEILELAPDLILAGRYARADTQALLRRLGYQHLVIDEPGNFIELRRQIEQVAAALGQGERGAALIEEIDRRLAVLREDPPGAGWTALPYRRRGYVDRASGGTDSLMKAVGLTNLAARVRPAGGFVQLEEVLALAPDLLVMDDAEPRNEDQASAILLHPALARSLPPSRRLILPRSLSACPGPSTPAALDRLAEQLAKLNKARRSERRQEQTQARQPATE